jgi:hypothetical protein
LGKIQRKQEAVMVAFAFTMMCLIMVCALVASNKQAEADMEYCDYLLELDEIKKRKKARKKIDF